MKSSTSWLLKLPESLQTAAYRAVGEAAWPAKEALAVLASAGRLDIAICGVEVWLPTTPGPTIPTPYFYHWSGEAREAGEGWTEFVRRMNAAAARYIRDFKWDPNDRAHQGLEAYFNLDAVSEY